MATSRSHRGPPLRALHHRRADRAAEKGRGAETQSRRLCGRACGGRSARRQRSLARCRGRLGQDDRVPRISLGPRARRRRSDGHRAARHGARLERRAGADPPRARGREAPARRARSPAASAPIISTPNARVTIDDIIRAYEQQIETIEAMGGRLIVMASRALARAASGPEDYARVYARILRQVKRAGDHPLARRDVRSGARRLLGRRRPHGRDGDLPRDPAGARRQDRRHQDLAAVEGEGDLDAPPPARRACACIPATTSTTRS